MWLFATYEVTLSRPVLVKAESAAPLLLAVNLRGWDAEVTLSPSDRLGRLKQPRDDAWYYPVTRLEITVARDGELGDEMVHEEAAKALIERLLVFLQLKRCHSFFTAIELYQQYQIDADVVLPGVEKIRPQLMRVDEYAQQNMFDYMGEYFGPALTEALLHDARLSLARQRHRRACLELSMVCESALGMRLESAALVKPSLGTLFLNQHSQAYEEIVSLFQMRDAMRHNGGGLFKFIPAAKKREMLHDLTRWQGAVECLLNWLNAMGSNAQEAL